MKTQLLLVFIASIFFFSCASQKGSSYSSIRYLDESDKSGLRGGESGDVSRVIIYNASVDLKVKNTDTTLSRIKAIALKHGGYATSLGNTYASIRVKAENLNAALADISRLGKVTTKSVSGEDVTDQYYDYTIRLENAQKARTRYLELLAKAENVEAALKVEKELERLNGEIDLLQGKINRLKHLEEYSTITVYIHQKKKLGVLGYVSVGLYKGVRWLFVRG